MIALDSIVIYLLETLPPLLLQEYNLPKDVEEKIKLLHDQMRRLNVFLEVSERMRNQHEIINEVVDQLRDALLEAEDVIDTYIYDQKQQRTKPCWDLVNYVRNSFFLHDLEKRINNIKLRIEEIERNQHFGTEIPYDYHGDTEAAEKDLRERRKNVEKVDVIGFEKQSKVVSNKLTGGRQELDVITIFAMPGSGKTTLARKVYDQVNKDFDFCSWTDVFEDCKVNDLLLKLLAQVGSELNVPSHKMTAEDPKEKLKSLLEKKKYLIVLDDIWEADVWRDIKDAFPDDKNGSRILITSRSKQVANFASTSPRCKYMVKPLKKKKAWDLFSERVFQGEPCPPELEDFAKLMAYRCRGLPLSIVVLAGLLAKLDRSEAIWNIVAGNEFLNLFKQKDKYIWDILVLSYRYLPRHLKPCFLYVGLYPKDFKIPARLLIRQWVAEGLIQDTGDRRPEDVAEYYLAELIDRSLIQVESKRSDGGVKICCVHDLLRELCIEESKKDKFYEVFVGNANSILAKTQRLSLYSRGSSYLSSSSSNNHSSVRSLICFAEESIDCRKGSGGERNNINRRYWESILKDFKSVRLLDIHSAQVLFDIPDGIKQLIHLRYIRIQTGVVSNNICGLWYLETLDMRGPPVISLPAKIWKLQRLRHLFMSGPVKMPPIHEPLDNLQTLSTVALEDHMRFVFQRIPMLRKLGLYYSQDLRWKPCYVWQEIKILSHLQTLKIIGTTQLPPANLFPSKLTKLTLKNVDDIPSPTMVFLGDIPNLEILKLSGDPSNRYEFDMDCETGKFQKLKVFQMQDLHCRNWNLATGSMSRLQSLSIINCGTLSKLPDELWALKHLQNVRVSSPSQPLADMLGSLEMERSNKITIL